MSSTKVVTSAKTSSHTANEPCHTIAGMSGPDLAFDGNPTLAGNEMRRRSCVSKLVRDRMEKGMSLNGNLKMVKKVPMEQKEIYVVESYDTKKVHSMQALSTYA
ncbi:hypothetical protein O6H91_06G013700 [Diphasiastrum complanatum]|uniref:Uncharacterized protein n=1 Tax=Diphasiastrum complanatum TaxID=34168 RepID=A0ACC2DB24_DIPCM|nr:hypothetical protein O6H91_06G013700 [Diphasiastrum complanatum]